MCRHRFTLDFCLLEPLNWRNLFIEESNLVKNWSCLISLSLDLCVSTRFGRFIIVKLFSCLYQTGPACRMEALSPPPPAWWWRSCTHHRVESHVVLPGHSSGSLEQSKVTLAQRWGHYFKNRLVVLFSSNCSCCIVCLTICMWLNIGEPLSL